LTSMSSS